MSRVKDITGNKYKNMMVLGDVGKRNKSGDVLWKCKCLLCDSEQTYARKYDLERGDYESCGCKRSNDLIVRNTKHGCAMTSEYKIYHGMIDRCNNPENPAYKDYGSRGIKVCDEWLHNFEQFISDMGFRPDKTYSIDRIDNNMGYSKNNCKWSTKSEQAYNRRKRKDCTSDYIGVHFDMNSKKYIARVWLDKKRIILGKFTDEMLAVKAIQDFKEGVANESLG